MARTKGSKNKPKTPKAETAAAEPARGIGDNSGLTDDQRKVIFFQHKRRCRELKEALDTANSRLKLAYKAAKADLGDDAAKDIKFALSADTPEGEEKAKAEMERRARILVWLGASAQLDLFGATDLTPEIDRARAAGKLAGMQGETCSPPFDHTVPQHDAWMDGWRQGQDLLVANLLRPLDEPTTELIPAGGVEARDAARLAEHDERATDDEPVETAAEAEARLRREAIADEAIANMAGSYAPPDDDLDIPEELDRRREIGDRKPTLRAVT